MFANLTAALTITLSKMIDKVVIAQSEGAIQVISVETRVQQLNNLNETDLFVVVAVTPFPTPTIASQILAISATATIAAFEQNEIDPVELAEQIDYVIITIEGTPHYKPVVMSFANVNYFTRQNMDKLFKQLLENLSY